MLDFRPRPREEPEINLIPFIDVLLVILIFLMLSTTYTRFTELQLTLPEANAQAQRERAKEVLVTVTSGGAYAVNKVPLPGGGVDALAAMLAEAAKTGKDATLIISADASAKHQAVVTAMEAARRAGLTHITFATQTATSAATR